MPRTSTWWCAVPACSCWAAVGRPATCRCCCTRGVTLSACGFGLRAHDLTLTDLVAGVVEVDSAARCVAHSRRQGWLFIRG